MQHIIGEATENVDVSSMAKMFSQMTEFLNGTQEKEKKEGLSEEFETAMKLKATQESICRQREEVNYRIIPIYFFVHDYEQL